MEIKCYYNSDDIAIMLCEEFVHTSHCKTVVSIYITCNYPNDRAKINNESKGSLMDFLINEETLEIIENIGITRIQFLRILS